MTNTQAMQVQVSSTDGVIAFNINLDRPEVKKPVLINQKPVWKPVNPSSAELEKAIECVSKTFCGLANKSDFKELFKGASVWDVKIMYGSSLN